MGGRNARDESRLSGGLRYCEDIRPILLGMREGRLSVVLREDKDLLSVALQENQEVQSVVLEHYEVVRSALLGSHRVFMRVLL
jgi:hypothetical protein